MRRSDDEGEWVTCFECGGDCFVGHDCGEDTCCCLYPEENLPCQTCNADGGWYVDTNTRLVRR